MMRSKTGFPLDDDLIHQVLASLDDFSTLASFMLSCKAVYAVFGAHPTSITQTIGYNISGPALPFALSAARAGASPNQCWEMPVESAVLADPITRDEAQRLEYMAEMASDLEDFFSWRHKDFTCSASQLTASESLRFCRALYLFSAFVENQRSYYINGGNNHDGGDESDEEDEDEDDDEEDDDKGARIDCATQRQITSLSTIPDPELRQVEAVVHFLMQTISWYSVKYNGYVANHSLWYELFHGPRRISDQLRGISDGNPFYGWSGRKPFFSAALEHVLEERKQHSVALPVDMLRKPLRPMRQALLDLESTVDRTCSHCTKITDEELYGRENWGLLEGIIAPRNPYTETVQATLPGKLSRNLYEMEPLVTYLTDDRHSWPQTMQQLFDDAARYGDDWSASDWLCDACLRRFIGDHIVSWWNDRKVAALQADGKEVPEDCWYGWNCRTQMHKRTHAENKNHMCIPTRGE